MRPRDVHGIRQRWLTVAAAALLTASCTSQTPRRDSDVAPVVRDGTRVTVPAGSPLYDRLSVEPVAESTVLRQVTAPAAVEAEPERQAKILPPLAGHVVDLFVHPGDRVVKGQPLVSIDAPDYVAAQADFTRAQSALAQADRTRARQQDLMAHGVIGQKDVDQAQTDRDAAASDYNRAKERLRSLGADPDQVQLGRPLVVRSPLPGKVLDVTTAPGEFRNDVTAPLMIVADLSAVWVTANVQERDVRSVRQGETVDVSLPAFPRERFTGHVLFVADMLDPDTRTAKVRVGLGNEDGRLRPAMFATVTVSTSNVVVLTVPTSALVIAGAKTTVFVEVAPHTFDQRPVEPGEAVGTRTVVLSGLSAGDRVLARDGALLQ